MPEGPVEVVAGLVCDALVSIGRGLDRGSGLSFVRWFDGMASDIIYDGRRDNLSRFPYICKCRRGNTLPR